MLNTLPLLLAVLLCGFLMVEAIPGDPAQSLVGERGGAEQVARVRAEWGLDQPWPHRLGRQVLNFAQGQWGTSFRTQNSVWSDIMLYFPATIELTVCALLLALLFGIPAGVIAALNRGRFWDLLCGGLSLAGVSIPVFWLGLLLIYACGDLSFLNFSGRSRWPVEDMATAFLLSESLLTFRFDIFEDALTSILLPAMTLATVPLATIARLTRSTLLEVLSQDHVRTAAAKGLKRWQQVMRHALRNASPGIITLVGLQTGALLTGAVLTESIFSWPGLGRYLIQSIGSLDHVAIRGCLMHFAFIFILVNFLTDLFIFKLDPRIRDHALV